MLYLYRSIINNFWGKHFCKRVIPQSPFPKTLNDFLTPMDKTIGVKKQLWSRNAAGKQSFSIKDVTQNNFIKLLFKYYPYAPLMF